MARLPRSSELVCRLKHQVGRRGYFLITLAVIDLYYGWSFIHPDSPAIAAQNAYMADVVPLAGRSIALWAWSLGWWMTAGFCLFNAFRMNDRFGYGMAFSLKIAWISANAVAGLNGMPGATTRCVVWTFIASSVLVIAKWPEPRNSFPEVMAEMNSTGELPRLPGPTDDGSQDGPDQGLGGPDRRGPRRLRGYLRHPGEPGSDTSQP